MSSTQTLVLVKMSFSMVWMHLIKPNVTQELRFLRLTKTPLQITFGLSKVTKSLT